jgi:glycosyltransferase involved in cell wall biosynthesis
VLHIEVGEPLSQIFMPRPIRVLELRSVRGTGGGPEKTILLGARPQPGSHVQVTVCYIRDSRDAAFGISSRAAAFPEIDYLEIVERHSFDIRVWGALQRLIASRGIDVVHAHDYKTDVLAFCLARRSPVVPMATAHAWVGLTPRERFVYHPGDKLILGRFPRVIAVSNDIKEELVRYGARPERVTVLPNAIDHRDFRRQVHREAPARAMLGISAGTFVVGAVGRLDPEKRFDVLLRAVARLKNTDTDVAVVIAGDGTERARLLDVANELGIGSRCHLLGFRGDVADLHHTFDVFVQTSIREGTSNAVLEAMAMETPVVATRAGGTAELITDNIHGILVPLDDAAVLADAIETVRRDPDGARQRTVSARARVEHELSFDERNRRLEQIYQRLLTPTGGASQMAESYS